MSQKQKLGRGLNALLGDPSHAVFENHAKELLRIIPIEKLQQGYYQPRQIFDETAIAELADSIREKGILQPLLVRENPKFSGSFEIIAGERRWRAAQKAQLHNIPAIVKDFSNQEVLEVGLIENLQREDLSPIDEARGLEKLINEFERTQQEVAEILGRSRSYVANMLRLLCLPTPIISMLEDGSLSSGHARALLGVENATLIAKEILQKGLSVRQVEKLVKTQKNKKTPISKLKDVNTASLEKNLSEALGLKIAINQKLKGGSLTIYYSAADQLDSIIEKLHGNFST